MYGAILGDMIGAPYEFDRGNKTKDFPLFSRGSQFTDDSVMTIAVAEALLGLDKDASDDMVHHEVSKSMRIWGRKYPDAGYGGRFRNWLFDHWKPHPYGSYGNGSAMRVSSVGWLYGSLEETRRYAKLTAEVTHNHPEGIKGAEATASAIFMARTGTSKDEIKDYIIKEFGYDLSRTCDEIRPTYHHVESCQETVPEAITAFLEGTSFEDVIRTAVSLGGDCDTLTCIAGSIAEAFYGVPDIDKLECRGRLPEEMLAVLDRFEEATNRKEYGFLDGTVLKEAMKMFNNDRTEKNLYTLLAILRDSFVWVPCNAILSEADYAEVEKAVKEAGDNLDSLIGKDFTNKDFVRLVPDILQNGDDFFFPVFATAEDMGEYGEHFSKVQKHFLECMVLARNNEKGVKGIVVNAFSEPFVLTVDLFDATARISSRFANAEVESDE